MRDVDQMMRRVCEEIDRIAEKGLTTANLETAYKLVDMYKDLKNTEYWETKTRYYETVLESMEDGYSQDGGYMMGEDGYSGRRRRDSMGRYSSDGGQNDSSYDRGSSYRRGYSRNRGGYSGNDGNETYDRYMQNKQSYRSDKSPECKQRLMDALDEHMDKFTKQMEEMLRDSDCAEERSTIRHYLDKIKNMA